MTGLGGGGAGTGVAPVEGVAAGVGEGVAEVEAAGVGVTAGLAAAGLAAVDGMAAGPAVAAGAGRILAGLPAGLANDIVLASASALASIPPVNIFEFR